MSMLGSLMHSNAGEPDYIFLCMLAYYVEWHMRQA